MSIQVPNAQIQHINPPESSGPSGPGDDVPKEQEQQQQNFTVVAVNIIWVFSFYMLIQYQISWSQPL